MAKPSEIHGMDPNLEKRLREMGIRSPQALLRNGGNGAGSLRISLQTGVPRERIETLVAQADLMQVTGVGVEHARRLVAGGVHSVEDLAGRDPTSLADALLESGMVEGASGQLRSVKQVARWVRQARSMTLTP